MALHPNFPESPYAILDPALRRFLADETLRESSSEKLMPPLVPQLRKKVKEWRDSSYVGATNTGKSLLNYWFNTPHLLPQLTHPRTFYDMEVTDHDMHCHTIAGMWAQSEFKRLFNARIQALANSLPPEDRDALLSHLSTRRDTENADA